MKLFDKLVKKMAGPITVDEVQHIFAYGKIKDLTGTSLPNEKHKTIGNNMSWKSEPYFYKGYKDIPAQDVPANIKWSNNPVFAYVGIVDNKIEYRFGKDGQSAYFICPVTTDAKYINLINEIFETWYNNFDLPNSLKEIEKPTKKISRADKMEFVKEYLANGIDEFFYERSDIIMFIDWREEDEQVINYCEDILRTGQLSVETIDADNKQGFETIITYKNKDTKIFYQGVGADRNTTIKTLNVVIEPDFEIRLCKNTIESDTLGFLPLSKEQWTELENQFSEIVDIYFEKIFPDTKLFR